jgi:hypothetical protein
MENYWYHVFLKAASPHARQIETPWKARLPQLGLSSAISTASGQVKVFRIIPIGSSRRVRLFYFLGMDVLAIMIFAPIEGHVPPDAGATAAVNQTAETTFIEATAALARATQALSTATETLSAQIATYQRGSQTATSPGAPAAVRHKRQTHHNPRLRHAISSHRSLRPVELLGAHSQK